VVVAPAATSAIIYLRSPGADRQRIRSDLGECGGTASLIRSPLSLGTRLTDSARTVRFAPVQPLLESVWNSRLPQSFDDGALWSGRGENVAVTAGVRADYRRITAVFAPMVTWSADLTSPTLPGAGSGRSPFASPFHGGTQSIDMPQRFGNQSYTQLTPGQSSLEVAVQRFGFGGSTENQWWGPGVANALVMSDNAEGVPQVYARTREPIATRLGAVEGRVLLGALTESRYFDTLSTNNLRSLSAAVVTLRLAADTGLTIGVARSVYNPVSGSGALWGHWADFLTRWRPIAPTKAGVDGSDQITSLFGRWVFPESGFEIYGEWARTRMPKSLRDFLVAPQRNQGYTAGLQWVDRLQSGNRLRVQAELTMLEHTPDSLGALTPSFYLSGLVPQGYTQRGQVIGAAIGPGASTQWAAADLLHRRWDAGLVLGRIRYDDDAYLMQQVAFAWWTHDVAVFAGARGGVRNRFGELRVSLSTTQRMNYLFQTAAFGFGESSAFDVHNLNLQMSLLPALSVFGFHDAGR